MIPASGLTGVPPPTAPGLVAEVSPTRLESVFGETIMVRQSAVAAIAVTIPATRRTVRRRIPTSVHSSVRASMTNPSMKSSTSGYRTRTLPILAS